MFNVCNIPATSVAMRSRTSWRLNRPRTAPRDVWSMSPWIRTAGEKESRSGVSQKRRKEEEEKEREGEEKERRRIVSKKRRGEGDVSKKRRGEGEEKERRKRGEGEVRKKRR